VSLLPCKHKLAIYIADMFSQIYIINQIVTVVIFKFGMKNRTSIRPFNRKGDIPGTLGEFVSTPVEVA
jgi:hypothetical protein